MKKRVYVDIDGVLGNYWKRFYELQNDYIRLPQSTYGFYTSLELIEGAIEGFNWLKEHFDVHILTKPSVKNKLCYTEKSVWVENNFGFEMLEKLHISYDKTLFKGDFLIDDHHQEGGEGIFEGEEILFGSDKFKNWESVINYLKTKI